MFKYKFEELDSIFSFLNFQLPLDTGNSIIIVIQMIYCSLPVPVHEMPQKKWLLHNEMQLYLTKDVIIYGSEDNHIINFLVRLHGEYNIFV